MHRNASFNALTDENKSTPPPVNILNKKAGLHIFLQRIEKLVRLLWSIGTKPHILVVEKQ